MTNTSTASEETLATLRSWLSGEPCALVCVAEEGFEGSDVAAWVHGLGSAARTVMLSIPSEGVEHHAVLQWVRALERAVDAEDTLPLQGLTVGALWSAAHGLVSRFGFREDESSPPNLLILHGWSRLADPSPRDWDDLLAVASAWTHLLYVDIVPPRSPALARAPRCVARRVPGSVEGSRKQESPSPATSELKRALRTPPGMSATPWTLSSAVRAQVEDFPRRAPGLYTLSTAPIYAQHDAWPLELARVLSTPAWLAGWRGRSDSALGVTLSVRRYRSRVEQECLGNGRIAELLPQVVGAALRESIVLSSIESPEHLSPPTLESLRASALRSLEEDPWMSVEVPGAWLMDSAGIGARAALLSRETAGGPLAEELVALQLRSGDEDTFLMLSRASEYLSDAQRATLIVHRLGHEDLLRMLRPHGSFACVTPLLRSLTDETVRLRVRLEIERTIEEAGGFAEALRG